jgi:hypothetical protein
MPDLLSRSLKQAAGAARDNLSFVSILIIGALMRVGVSLAYRPAILVLEDSYYYLRAALGPSEDLGFDRPFLYSAFLKPLLAVDSLALVTAVQHALVLAIAVALYGLLRHLGVPRFLCVMCTALLLLDAYQLNLEHQILTEALFETLLVASVALLAWWQKAAPWVFALAGALLGLASITRFVGLGMMAAVLLYVLLRRVGWLGAAAVAMGFVVPLFVYATWYKGESGRGFGLASKPGHQLYAKVAGFARCSREEMPRSQRPLCITKPVTQRRDFYGRWHRDSPIYRIPPGVDKEEATLSFAMRFILRQPVDYVRVVARDFVSFFTWISTRDLFRPSVRRWEFFKGLKYYHRLDVGISERFRRTAGAPPPELGLDHQLRLHRPIASALVYYQQFAYVRGPILALLACLGLVGAFIGRPVNGWRDTRPEALLLTLGGLSLYLFSSAFSTFHFRYVIPGLALLGPAGALGASLIWNRWGHRRYRECQRKKERGSASVPTTGPRWRGSHTAETARPLTGILSRSIARRLVTPSRGVPKYLREPSCEAELTTGLRVGM